MSDELGRYNRLKVIKRVDFGVYLETRTLGEVLLPAKYLERDIKVGDQVNVFIYLDSEDAPVATTEKPKAQVDEFAFLKVVDAGRHGAFLDWGLQKDLLVPFSEQRETMEVGKSYLVRIFIDDITHRIAASSKVDRFLDRWPAQYEHGQEVTLTIANQTELGYKAIVNHNHWGVIYANEVFRRLHYGSTIKGFVRKVREDGKIDLMLQKSSQSQVSGLEGDVLERLKNAGGYLAASDKSSPETIKRMFGVSKRVFKQTIGSLYKQKKITIEEQGIRLVE
ncbi:MULTISPECIES: CvfB family protein [Corallincola]|uniref:GntR family transcriptional regulator n=2 Tax=Corallincola TaxID=1775176 RepID=A0A368NL15_9GAMM|nr:MULTISPECIES: S1-like domain-containing RNA-binding protein [Corallincola]RCU50465.1 GntR family transcriptional regulator [Corallincola holothuriorum]TAA48526.1 GntR family transcriptional regulator [Corallincola spongiicola]